MNKKGVIIIVIGGILVLSGLLLVIYLFLFADDPDEGFQNIRNFLPFGEREYVVREPEPTDVNDEPVNSVFTDQILRIISEHPVAENGFYVFTREDETYVRYISRGEGNMYEVNVTGEEHISLLNEDNFFTGAQRVSWVDENNFMIFSLLEDKTKTVTVSLTQEEVGFNWNGKVLPENTLAYAVHPENNMFFYTTESNNGGVDGYTTSFNGVSGKHLFSSKIKEWLIDWPTNGKITLTTKPSGYVPGHMYTLNTQNMDLRHTLRAVAGLTTLTNKNASLTLYNNNDNNDVSLRLLNHHEKSSSNISNIQTLTDKCVWKDQNVFVCAVPEKLTSGIYPDSWYQGKVSFNDSLFKEVNTETGQSKDFLDIKEIIYDFDYVDAYNLKFNELENHFFFIDKKTGDLWVYDLD